MSYFIILFLVQWLTFEVADLLLIENHLLLWLLSCLFSIIFRNQHTLTGAIVFVSLLLLLMYLDSNLSAPLINVCGLLVLGAATGTFIKQKKWWFVIGSFILSIIVFWHSYRSYSSIEVVNLVPKEKTDLVLFNRLSKTFISQKGDSLQLSLDTVYLINFTFYACKPCREKQPSLNDLKNTFANQPFKIVTIHCVDSINIFKKYYPNDNNTFHNANEKTSSEFGVNSYPFEIIYSRKGKEARRFNGFSRDIKEDYLTKTTHLIKKLLHEK